jgi:hypothetical protein
MNLSILLLFLAFTGHLVAAETPAAIVYGPKAGFNIVAPEKWVVDHTAGAEDGLPCVLFPKGQSWETADPLMYAKVASAEYEDAEAFAKKAIAEAKKERGEFEVKRIESGKTKSGQTYFINEYSPNADYPRHERVAYVQLEKAVAYLVFSGDNLEIFRKEQAALKQAVESLVALTVKKEQPE